MSVLMKILAVALVGLAILAVILAAAALIALSYIGLLRVIDYAGTWMDEHPEEGKKHG